MSDAEESIDDGGQVEAAPDTGQAAETPAPVEGQPEAAPQPNWEKQYKEVQGAYTKSQQALADFERKFATFGGAERLLQTASALQSNPEFTKWVQAQNKPKIAGYDPDSLDAESRQALELVEKVAAAKTSAAVKEILQKHVQPLVDNQKKAAIGEQFKAMDGKYGAEWREMNSAMVELLRNYPKDMLDNPTFDLVESVYLQALARDKEKWESMQAKTYQKRLQAKQAKTTGMEKAADGVKPKKALTWKEASAQTMREMGITRIPEPKL